MTFLRHDLPRILFRVALAWLCVLAWGNPFLHRPSEAEELQQQGTPQPSQPAPRVLGKKTIKPVAPHRSIEVLFREENPDRPKEA